MIDLIKEHYGVLFEPALIDEIAQASVLKDFNEVEAL